MRQLQHRTLYVGGLSEDTDDDDLRELFAAFGSVRSARVVTSAGRSRGFGYVTFQDDDVASVAASRLDGTTLGDSRLRVAPAP